ncbi:hypothetical protein HKX48_001115 [Thoreauomyces humboldtii]|nr:hypothetical protein HKX48_001115 [Thoreauomyces humboldtii]
MSRRSTRSTATPSKPPEVITLNSDSGESDGSPPPKARARSKRGDIDFSTPAPKRPRRSALPAAKGSPVKSRNGSVATKTPPVPASSSRSDPFLEALRRDTTSYHASAGTSAPATINSPAVSDSESDEDWEELGTTADAVAAAEEVTAAAAATMTEASTPAAIEVPAEGGFSISVRQPPPDPDRKPSKYEVWMEQRRRKFLRLVLYNRHRANLMALFYCGVVRNGWCDGPYLQGLGAAVLPDDVYRGLTGMPAPGSSGARKGKTSSTSVSKNLLHYLSVFAKWWSEFVLVQDSVPEVSPNLVGGAQGIGQKFTAYTGKEEADRGRFVSSEVSVLLFTAACRKLGLKARLVCSLNPWPISPSHVKPPSASSSKATPKSGRKKGRATKKAKTKKKPVPSSESEESDVDEDTFVTRPSTTRKRKMADSIVVDDSEDDKPLSSKVNTAEQATPTEWLAIRYWTEVYSDVTDTWIPVDPIENIVNEPLAMEPKQSLSKHLWFTYVVAYDSVFGVKDVTQRYVRHWGARTSRLRLPKGVAGEGWWKRTLWYFSKPKSSLKAEDKLEDEHLKQAAINEPMPTTFDGFKNHPLYALERHLTKFEVIHPMGPKHTIGIYKKEDVYPRSLVRTIHTKETWLKQGREVLADAVPIKKVKARVATIARARQVEAERMAGGPQEASKSATFGEWQTVEFVPRPLVNGKIPVNTYGNVEIFHDRMIPLGCNHDPRPGLANVAKKLGIEYATAVTGFDFHKGRSHPVIQGIVYKEEDDEVLMDAFREYEIRAAANAAKKRSKRAISAWKKFTTGLVTRDRLRREYGPQGDEDEHSEEHGSYVKEEDDEEEQEGGGFFMDEDE